MWQVYIIQCADKTLYAGITVNLKRRIWEHNNSPLGAKYTRGRRPVKLAYAKKMKNKSLAAKEEARIKKLPKRLKLNLIYDSGNRSKNFKY